MGEILNNQNAENDALGNRQNQVLIEQGLQANRIANLETEQSSITGSANERNSQIHDRITTLGDSISRLNTEQANSQASFEGRLRSVERLNERAQIMEGFNGRMQTIERSNRGHEQALHSLEQILQEH